MVNLLDLPKELLLEIIVETLPDGIVALAQCSSCSYFLSSDALKKHKAYIERYKIIKIEEEQGPGPLLYEVLETPAVDYILDLQVLSIVAKMCAFLSTGTWRMFLPKSWSSNPVYP